MEHRSTAPAEATTSPVGDGPVTRARPHRRRSRTAASMVLQVVLIGLGVFLGLAGEEWREDRENNRLAAETLRRFRTELVANRTTIMSVKDYHAERFAELNTYFAAPVETRDPNVVRFAGLKPLTLERGAWDVALATGSLAYIEPELAFLLSSTYGYQSMAAELGRVVMDRMYSRPPTEADSNFFAVAQLYYGDLVGMEAGFIAAYDELIPAIDLELAE
jgi:hypothetical protein